MPKLYQIKDPESINYEHSRSKIVSMEFHLHDGFEIYFLISGDVNYLIEKRVYPIQYGDLIITNSFEVHVPVFLSDKTYERIFLQFGPELPKLFSLPKYDLLNCFTNRLLGSGNKISLDNEQLKDILELFSRIEGAKNSNISGSEILLRTAFIELLVIINRAYINIEQSDEHSSVPPKLMPVLDYIDINLEGDLSLKLLESKFFINRYYICKLFKGSMGINLHEYITFKRISKAKRLLVNGMSATEACIMSGFLDYSNFVRVFKKIAGVSPHIYKKANAVDIPDRSKVNMI